MPLWLRAPVEAVTSIDRAGDQPIMNQDFGVNQAFVEELFLRYQENPSTVGERWRTYFDGLQTQAGHGAKGRPMGQRSAGFERPGFQVVHGWAHQAKEVSG